MQARKDNFNVCESKICDGVRYSGYFQIYEQLPSVWAQLAYGFIERHLCVNEGQAVHALHSSCDSNVGVIVGDSTESVQGLRYA